MYLCVCLQTPHTQSPLSCVIMADSDPVSLHLPPEGPSNARVEQVIKVKSLVQIEKKVRSAIWRPFGPPGRLFDIKVSLNPYIVKLVFETSGQVFPLETEEKTKVQHVWFEEYESTPTTDLLYKNPERVMAVEVQETSVQGLALPVVRKLCQCQGCLHLNDAIREAFLQVRVASAYSCKLLNLYISRGSGCLFEVGLILEKLNGDLEMDMKHRLHGNHYSEAELINTLHCVTEALLYAKLRVKFT